MLAPAGTGVRLVPPSRIDYAGVLVGVDAGAFPDQPLSLMQNGRDIDNAAGSARLPTLRLVPRAG